MGYHIKKNQKGILGETSKIQEELDELKDAIDQDIKILILCELSDIYGALEAVADKYNCTMDDLKKMSDATRGAFKYGQRN